MGYTWDDMYDKLKVQYGGLPGKSTQDMLDQFWIDNGYPDGVPGNDAREAFYESRGAVGSSLGDVENDFWNRIGPNIMVGLGATFAIDARNSVAGEQIAVNYGTGGAALNATYGSTGGADTNDPLLLTHTGENYLYLPGVAGNNASTPDAATLDLTSAVEIIARIAPADWSPAAETIILGKRDSGTTTSYQLIMNSTNTFLRLSFDGTALINLASSNAPLGDGVAGWIKGSWRSSDGAWTIDYAPDQVTVPTTWTNLGSGTSSVGSSIFVSASLVEIGSQGANTSGHFAGNIYRTIVNNGPSGAAVLDVDFTTNTSHTTFTESSSSAATVTINRSGSGRMTAVVTRPIWLCGTDDYMEIADNALVNFGTNQAFTVVVIARIRTDSAVTASALIGKGNYGAVSSWSLLRNNPTNPLDMIAYVGGPTVADYNYSAARSSPPAAGSIRAVASTRDGVSIVGLRDGTNLITATAGSAGSPASIDLSNATPVTIGSTTVSRFYNGEILAVGIFRRYLSDAEFAQIVSFYGAA